MIFFCVVERMRRLIMLVSPLREKTITYNKKLRYWLQKWNMRRISFQYNCNRLLRILGCKNSFNSSRYCYIMRWRHIRDFLVDTRICLKNKFRSVIEYCPALSDYTIWLSIEFLPFWQRLPPKPEGHKHRYLSTVNPDWQVPPFKQLNSSQAFLKEKQRK